MLLVIIPSAAGTTITLNLIHRDSPLSPLYTPNDTLYDRRHASFLRSISRSHVAAAVNFQTEVIPSGGEYFMNLSIGTPPFQLLAIADTGSDLTWVQSKPCDQCYHQKSPIFDPSNSSTLRKLPCGARPCNSLDDTARSCHDGTCGYTYSYGDHSYTTGFLATDTFTISSGAIQNVAFGCGTRNGGTFDEAGSGIVGLGGGGGGGDVKLPSMKVHFKGGAEVELKPVNTFVRAEEKLICLTMVPTKDVGIFGNLAQLNFVVGYDLGKRTVSFLPADCSKH
ncbi:Probable aspartic protease At2g35615 [Linum perenne]